jgi:predicted GNAT superfamily acetyltransferase
VGRRLKLAQRDWALRQGATHLVWTYDPLIRRNAHFNLNRLGARVTSFVPDYYPPMSDAVNAGDLPDRFVVEWRLADEIGGRPLPPGAGASPVVLGHDAADEPVLRLDVPATGGASEGGESSGGDELAGVDESSEGGEPSEGGPWIVRAWVPSDIEALRLRDPALGRRWRLAAREAFETLFARGFTPVGVDAEGHYVFVREA